MSLAFMNIGTQELILIVIVALVLFGGKKLPEIARGLGRGIREFKDASDDIKREISDQINNFDKELDIKVEDKPASQKAIAGEINDRAETDPAGEDEENKDEQKAYPAFTTPENTYPHHPGEQPSSDEEHYRYGYSR